VLNDIQQVSGWVDEAIEKHECIYLMKDKLRYTFEALGFEVPSDTDEDFYNTVLLKPDAAVARAVAQSPIKTPPRSSNNNNNVIINKHNTSPVRPQPPQQPIHRDSPQTPGGSKRPPGDGECVVS